MIESMGLVLSRCGSRRGFELKELNVRLGFRVLRNKRYEDREKAQLAAQGVSNVQHFAPDAPDEEEKQLSDLAFFADW